VVEAAGVELDRLSEYGLILKNATKSETLETVESLKIPGGPPNRPQQNCSQRSHVRHQLPTAKAQLLEQRAQKPPTPDRKGPALLAQCRDTNSVALRAFAQHCVPVSASRRVVSSSRPISAFAMRIASILKTMSRVARPDVLRDQVSAA
jgi:hypothetical protein